MASDGADKGRQRPYYGHALTGAKSSRAQAKAVLDRLARHSRADDELRKRSRRSDSYRGYDLKLDVPEQFKDPRYVYGWCTDDKGKVQRRTLQDDWDFVAQSELKIPSHDDAGFGAKNLNEADTRIRRVVDDSTAAVPKFAYLLKMPRDLYDLHERDRVRENERRRLGMIRSQRASGEDGADEGHEDPNDFDEHAYLPGNVKEAIGATERRIKRAQRSDKGKPRGPRRESAL